MLLNFSKYHGAGNDFIIVDNRLESFPKDCAIIKHLCDRHFGIGADGLMLLESSAAYDFKMIYYNADGNESTMCGNGGRCITLFAKQIGLINSSAHFMGIDGEHNAIIETESIINLKMQDIPSIDIGNNYYFINTGSPHYVRFVDDVERIDVNTEGKAIRNNFNIQNGGTNVNFVDFDKDSIRVRTFERGVESETLACGTGSVASAIAYCHHTKKYLPEYKIQTQGGVLFVKFKMVNDCAFKDVWLKGPAIHVFDGKIAL